MSQDFQQTVDLKDKMKPQRHDAAKAMPAEKKIKKKRDEYGQSKKAEKLDRIFDDESEEILQKKRDFQKFNLPVVRQVNESFFKRATIALAVILVAVVLYGLFFLEKSEPIDGKVMGVGSGESAWYAVELVNKEVYYGQIIDIAADPIEMKNVYYNYDQLNKENSEINETGNLRLVKRGKETHGPSGTMYIYQEQINKIDGLSEESKVLKAILDYEK